MECTRAQDLVLDELDGEPDEAVRDELRRHLDSCPGCQAFAALQRRLDASLREGVPGLAPDAGFERRVGERLGAAWPEWLPELAYVAGAVLATFACVLALPLPVAHTWWIGGALAGLGLFVHSLVAKAFSRLDALEG
jgi:anti-sigma factor RsiW